MAQNNQIQGQKGWVKMMGVILDAVEGLDEQEHYIQPTSYSKSHLEITARFSPLKRYEIDRWLEPHGPISLADFKKQETVYTRLEELDTRDVYGFMHDIYQPSTSRGSTVATSSTIKSPSPISTKANASKPDSLPGTTSNAPIIIGDSSDEDDYKNLLNSSDDEAFLQAEEHTSFSLLSSPTKTPTKQRATASSFFYPSPEKTPSKQPHSSPLHARKGSGHLRGQPKPEEAFEGLWTRLYENLQSASEKEIDALDEGFIHFRGCMDYSEVDLIPKLRISLLPPTWDMGYRFAREQPTRGSDRFLNLTLADSLIRFVAPSWTKEKDSDRRKVVRNHLSRPIFFLGRIYRPVTLKDSHLFYFATDPHPLIESIDLRCQHFSLEQFVSNHIDLQSNSKMKWSKFTARFDLGFSKTTRAFNFKVENVRRVPDVFNNSLWVSLEGMKRLQNALGLGLDYVPSTIKAQYPNGEIRTWWTDFERNHRLIKKSQLIRLRSSFVSKSSGNFVLVPLHTKLDGQSINGSPVEFSPSECEIVEAPEFPTNMEMTDGCGLMSRAAFRKMTMKLDADSVASAVQARCGNAKGLWLEDPRDEEDNIEWIEIRDSQAKWNEGGENKFILEVNDYSVAGSSSSVGKQAIPFLAYNGIPNELFVRRVREDLHQKTTLLTAWDDTNSLIECIEKLGNVMFARLERLRAEHRVSSTFYNEREDSYEGLTYRDDFEPYCQAPENIADVIIQMLRAGFDPRSDAALAAKLVTFGKKVIKNALNFQVSIPLSWFGFIVVDPIGVLKENECQVVFSQPIIDPITKHAHLGIEGPALVMRSPVTQITGIRLLTGVKHPDILRLGLHNCLIVANTGVRPMCDYLSGGDYDGDKVVAIWDPEFVQYFRSHSTEDLKTSSWPEREFFDIEEQTVESVFDVLNELQSSQKLSQKMIEHVFEPRLFGLYSNIQTKLIYILDPDHELTRLAGWFYEKTLDARKQGLRLKKKKKKEFEQLMNNEGVPSDVTMPKYWKHISNENHKQNETLPVRRSHLPPFVMDAIMNGCTKFQKEFEGILESQLQNIINQEDPHLTRIWKDFREFADSKTDKTLHSDLNKIESAVENCFREFCAVDHRTSNLNLKQRFSAISELFSKNPTDLSSDLWSIPRLGQRLIRELKASYAYTLRFKGRTPASNALQFGRAKRTTFALEVAFRELLCLKSAAITSQSVKDRLHTDTHLEVQATPVIDSALQAMFTKRIGDKLEGRSRKRARR